MKLSHNLACILSYAIGVPKRIIIEKHAACQSIDSVFKSNELKCCRYCAYLRQYLITTKNAITEDLYYRESRKIKTSFKDESTFTDSVIYIVENKIININNKSRYKQFLSLNKKFVETFRQYLENVFIENNYKFEIDYLMDILDFECPEMQFDSLCKQCSGRNFDKRGSLFPAKRILNLNSMKLQDMHNSILSTFVSILNDDETLLRFIYDYNGETFTESSISQAVDGTEIKNKISFNDFMALPKEKVIFVDCENASYYKVLKLLQNKQFIHAIKKVYLIDDACIDDNQTQWNKLSNEVDITIEYISVHRVLSNKSLVDGMLILKLAQVYYEENKPDFFIISSDSDFFILGDNIPEVTICFLHEEEKVSSIFLKAIASKKNIIAQSIEPIAEGYEQLALDDLMDRCVNLLNIYIRDCTEPIINKVITAQNIYDDDGKLYKALHDGILKLKFVDEGQGIVVKRDKE